MSQDRDETTFCSGLLTGLHIVGIFHTMQQLDKKMSIFQKKKSSTFYCKYINNFSQLYGQVVIEKNCYFTCKYFSFTFPIFTYLVFIIWVFLLFECLEVNTVIVGLGCYCENNIRTIISEIRLA